MRLTTVLLVAALLAGCSLTYEGRVGEAQQIATAFLGALQRGDVETAWSNLMEEGGAGRPDKDSFRREVESADWARFEWQIRGAYCDDLQVCPVDVAFPKGIDAVPRFLLYTYDRPSPRYAALQQTVLDGVPHDAATLTVAFEFPVGRRGVQTYACCGG